MCLRLSDADVDGVRLLVIVPRETSEVVTRSGATPWPASFESGGCPHAIPLFTGVILILSQPKDVPQTSA